MRTLVLVLGTIGCGFNSQSAKGGEVDAAPIDTSVVGEGPCVSWPALNIDPCNGALGGQGPVIVTAAGSYRLDTDSGTLAGPAGMITLPGAMIAQMSSGPMVRVVNATALTIGATATISVVGSHPVIFVVHGSARIDGIVDASAGVDNGTRTPGPGGNDVLQCTGATGADAMGSSGTGGGGGAGGGAYGANGGNGGDGQGNGHGSKGAKGSKIDDPTTQPLRGGCRGGVGGDDFGRATDEGGRPGDGGGAIEITALGQIVISGTIAAGGSGGGAGGLLARAGGGGGGSGGAIVIDGEVSTVIASGKLCANGGGGGEGGQLIAAPTSSSGAAAICTTMRAAGGATQDDGGDGGDGGAADTGDGTDGKTGASSAAGGGGGGSVGRIRVRGRTQRMIEGGIVTPVASS